MRLVVAQINPIIGDIEGNTEKILAVIERSRQRGAEVVLFPELTICGYPPEDLVLHSAFIDAMERALETIIEGSQGVAVIIGFVRRNLHSGGKPLLNSAAIIHDRKLLGFYDKWLLPTYDVFNERRYFEPGTQVPLWDLFGKKVAVIICEDIWQHAGYTDTTRYAADPILELLAHKPDLLLNLSASPYQFLKPDVRIKVCIKAAKTLRCPVALCCQVGADDQIVFDGYSVYVDREGHLVRLGKGFEEEEMLIEVDQPLHPYLFTYDPMEDLYKALVLGIRDYFVKQGFSKGCLGLSGGIDSALVACLAVEALGKENVLCVNMPSRYSTEGPMIDAKQLAERLGVAYWQIPIEGPFNDYLELLNPYFEGREAGVAEENLQARIRGMILMAISNKLGYVVLSTGNKSELAMGFCTLYGDMAGGLAVISDVIKTHVYALANWINRKEKVIPQTIIDRAPSAELRINQKDSDTLPDYAIVDQVLQSYVEDLLSPEEVSRKHNLPIELVHDLVRKIHQAEYKRRQAPLGIRVSKKAFRAGRHYPIVQRWIK